MSSHDRRLDLGFPFEVTENFQFFVSFVLYILLFFSISSLNWPSVVYNWLRYMEV